MSSLQPLFSGAQYQQIKERDDALAELARCQEGVTVCVPCYEDHSFLARSLASVRAQTVQPVRFMVIDDGSALESSKEIKAIALEYGADYVWVTNRGLASARNTALMLSDTLAFLPLDADDWIDEQYIEKTLPLLRDADVVLTGIQEHGPSRNGTYMPGYDRPHDQVSAELILNEYNRFYYCTIVRTQLLREVGGYNAKMNRGLEDADLWVDLLRRGARFAAVQEALLHYSTENPNSMLMTIHRDGGYEEMVTEMRRHHDTTATDRSYLARAGAVSPEIS